ncbi:ASI1A protein, partial [Polypterus senegalus]
MESRMRYITCIVRERQLWYYGHVAHFPKGDPAHKILIDEHPSGWTRPRGRPHKTWLWQMEGHFWRVGLDRMSACGGRGGRWRCCTAKFVMDLKGEPEDGVSQPPPALDAFASRSTLHGISHIFSSGRFRVKRCFWLCCFLGSFSILLYVCVDRVHLYLQYPHVTKLDEVAAPVIIFPAVTFCNLNEFRFSRVTRNDLYHAGELLALLNHSSSVSLNVQLWSCNWKSTIKGVLSMLRDIKHDSCK